MALLQKKQSLNLSRIENGWFHEKNDAWSGICNSYAVDKILAVKRSKFQEILLFQSHNGSRTCQVLVLDGVVQFDTVFEHIYHEMLVHVPMFAHPDPKQVLVLGGGDGGCIREILKHHGVERVVWVEIDEDVVSLTKEFVPSVHVPSIYADHRMELLIDDGIAYVEKCKDEIFDVIIVDGSDPIGTSPSASLFTPQFYKHCHRILKNGGIINSQNDCMFDSDLLIEESMKASKAIHGRGDVKYCTMYTPMYTSGQLGCVLSQKYCPEMERKFGSTAVDRIYRNIPDEIQKTLKYYSANMHTASFVLPYHIEQKLSKL